MTASPKSNLGFAVALLILVGLAGVTYRQLATLDDVLEGSDFVGGGHPTEKPVDLLARLIKATTDEGQCVVDPFAGTGSTVFAAMNAGREFFAIEKSKEYFDAIASSVYERIA